MELKKLRRRVRYERKGKEVKRGNAGMQNTGVRELENSFPWNRFWFKTDFGNELFGRNAPAGRRRQRKRAKKGGTRRFQGAVQQVRKIFFLWEVYFSSNQFQRSFFWARLGCRNDESRRLCGEVRGEIDTMRLNRFTILPCCEASWIKIDFRNLFWVEARMQAINDESRERKEKSDFGWNKFSFPLFLSFFNQGQFRKYALDEIAISLAISMGLRESTVNEEDETKTLYYLDQK